MGIDMRGHSGRQVTRDKQRLMRRALRAANRAPRFDLLKRHWWDGFIHGALFGALVVAVCVAIALG